MGHISTPGYLSRHHNAQQYSVAPFVILQPPFGGTSFGKRVFSSATPSSWNSLRSISLVIYGLSQLANSSGICRKFPSNITFSENLQPVEPYAVYRVYCEHSSGRISLSSCLDTIKVLQISSQNGKSNVWNSGTCHTWLCRHSAFGGTMHYWCPKLKFSETCPPCSYWIDVRVISTTNCSARE